MEEQGRELNQTVVKIQRKGEELGQETILLFINSEEVGMKEGETKLCFLAGKIETLIWGGFQGKTWSVSY